MLVTISVVSDARSIFKSGSATSPVMALTGVVVACMTSVRVRDTCCFEMCTIGERPRRDTAGAMSTIQKSIRIE